MVWFDKIKINKACLGMTVLQKVHLSYATVYIIIFWAVVELVKWGASFQLSSFYSLIRKLVQN